MRRSWAKLSELKSGDLLIVAHSLGCLDQGSIVEVMKYAKRGGGFCVNCACGKHDLYEHKSESGNLVGFYKTNWNMRNA